MEYWGRRCCCYIIITHTHIYIYIGWVEEDCAFFFLVVCLLWLRGNKVETDKTRQSVSERTEPKASFASSTVYVCGKWKGVRGGGGGGSLVGSQAQEGEEEEEEKWNRRRRTWIYPSHIYGSIDIRRQEENIDNRGGKEEKKRKNGTDTGRRQRQRKSKRCMTCKSTCRPNTINQHSFRSEDRREPPQCCCCFSSSLHHSLASTRRERERGENFGLQFSCALRDMQMPTWGEDDARCLMPSAPETKESGTHHPSAPFLVLADSPKQMVGHHTLVGSSPTRLLIFFCFLLSSHQCRRPIDAVSLVRLLSTVGYYGRALHTQQHPVAASTILLLLLLRGDLNANSTATVTGVSAETLSAWWSILTAKNRWDMCFFFVFVF